MKQRTNKRRYRKASDRRVWVFSDLNHDLTPEHMAALIARAGLERARLEASKKAEAAPGTEEEASDV